MLAILSILVIGFVIIFFYSRLLSHRKLVKSGVPIVPSTHWFKGNLDFFLSPSAVFDYGRMSRQYGRSYGMLHGGVPVIVTSDVDVIHAISQKYYSYFHSKMHNPMDPDPVESSQVHMFNAQGERWKRMRAITSQAISTKNMSQLYSTMIESIDSFITYVDSLVSEKPQTFEIHKLFQNHTSDVLARCAFGQNVSRHENNQYFTIFQKTFGNIPLADNSLQTIAWCLPSFERSLKSLEYIQNFIKSKINPSTPPIADFNRLLSSYRSARTVNDNKNDFLQFFKNAESCDFVGYKSEQYDGYVDVSKLKICKEMHPDEITAQCRFISIAGFDTTANTLSIICYLLAANPDIMATLLEELDSTEELTFNSTSSLTYLHNCILETLRLFPHASPLQHRTCVEDIKIDNIMFQKGVSIIMDPWTVHHDESIWGPDVEEFKPNRFNDLTISQKKAFMPFGVGPRQCVGMRFALIEMKATLSHFLKHFEISRCEKQEKLTMTLRDTGTVWPDEVLINIRRRQPSVN